MKRRRTYHRHRNPVIAHIAKIENKEIKLFWFFLVGTFVLAALQVYLVIHMAVLAADQNNLSHTVVAMRSDVGQLESTYLTQSKDLSLARAKDLGFVEAHNVLYAKETALSLRNISALTDNEI